MGFIGFSVWSTYQVLFFVALGIIFIMCIIMGIQSAKAADRKQDIKQKIIDYEKDIADRNRVISKQTIYYRHGEAYPNSHFSAPSEPHYSSSYNEHL